VLEEVSRERSGATICYERSENIVLSSEARIIIRAERDSAAGYDGRSEQNRGRRRTAENTTSEARAPQAKSSSSPPKGGREQEAPQARTSQARLSLRVRKGGRALGERRRQGARGRRRTAEMMSSEARRRCRQRVFRVRRRADEDQRAPQARFSRGRRRTAEIMSSKVRIGDAEGKNHVEQSEQTRFTRSSSKARVIERIGESLCIAC
jgi:hypothetical protein